MNYRYYLLLVLTSLLWGGNFIVGKTLTFHASPLTLTSLRWLVAILVLMPLVLWKEKRFFPAKKALIPLIFMGATGVVLFQVLQFMALEKTSTINVGLISTLNMISIALFSFLFLREKMNLLQLMAMMISIAGVILVLTNGHVQLLATMEVNRGDFYMLGAVCVWGIYSVCSKRAMEYESPLMATLYSGVFGLLILLPFSGPTFAVTNLNASFIGALFYTGVVSTVVCMLFWNIGLQKLGANTSGLFLNLNPVFTAILAFLLLGETLTWIQGVGSLIVISGCFLFAQFKTKKRAFGGGAIRTAFARRKQLP